MLEDLILSGVKKAIADGKALAQSEMGKLTGGMGLPPGWASRRGSCKVEGRGAIVTQPSSRCARRASSLPKARHRTHRR